MLVCPDHLVIWHSADVSSLDYGVFVIPRSLTLSNAVWTCLSQQNTDKAKKKFLSFLRTHMSFFGATDTPVLDFWLCLLWVLKPEWVLPYSLFCGGECNVHSLRSTSGATYVNLLAACINTCPVPTYCCRGEAAGIRTHALRISVSQTLYQLS